MRQTNGNFLVWTSMTMGGCSQNHKCCHLTMKPQASCDSTCYMDTVGLLMFTVLTKSFSLDIKNWSTGIRICKADKLQKPKLLQSLQMFRYLAKLCFVHHIFHFWSHWALKLQKYYIICVYILQGKMGKAEKNGNKTMQLKWPTYQKPKDEKYEMNETYIMTLVASVNFHLFPSRSEKIDSLHVSLILHGSFMAMICKYLLKRNQQKNPNDNQQRNLLRIFFRF